MKYLNKAIIFDWSGTLSNNFHCFAKASAMMFKELGRKPITEDEIRKNFTTPYMKFWNHYFPRLAKKKQCVMYLKYIHLAGEPRLYKGSTDTVKYLHKKGYKLFVVSGDPLSKLLPEIKKRGLLPYFTKIVGNVHRKKKSIAMIAKQFNKSYYVGDTSGDIEEGKSAGVQTIGITWGFQHRNIIKKSKPDYLINEIKELKKIT